MLDFIFGFHARLGRLNFFLSTAGLSVILAICAAMIAIHGAAYRSEGPDALMQHIFLPIICIIPFVIFVTFTLQSMRIRDIGWNPVYVIPAWVAFMIFDAAVATWLPVFSVGRGRPETILGLLVNLGMTGVLFFWPSGPARGGSWQRPIGDALQIDDRPAAPSRSPSPTPRVMTMRRGPAGSGFGRRGL